MGADYGGLDGQCDVVCLMAVVNSTVYTLPCVPKKSSNQKWREAITNKMYAQPQQLSHFRLIISTSIGFNNKNKIAGILGIRYTKSVLNIPL